MDLKSHEIRAWLEAKATQTGTYQHFNLREKSSRRKTGLAALAAIVEKAHSDQRAQVAKLMEPLDPLGRSRHARVVDLAALFTTTLQGYVGEIFAGVVAANYRPHGRSWVVPAFTFRFDQDAESALVEHLCGWTPPPATFGRHGHDCLAFAVDERGAIDGYLASEGKCTRDHRKAILDTGHSQLSASASVAADVLRLLQILAEAAEGKGQAWSDALRTWLYDTDEATRESQRYDSLVYICGRSPKPPRVNWMQSNTPNEEYKAKRGLAVAEVHIPKVLDVIKRCYPGHQPRDA